MKAHKPEPRASAPRAFSGGLGGQERRPGEGSPSGCGAEEGAEKGSQARALRGPAQRGRLPAPAWLARERGSGAFLGNGMRPFNPSALSIPRWRSLCSSLGHTHGGITWIPVASFFSRNVDDHVHPGASRPCGPGPGAPPAPSELGLRGCGWLPGGCWRALWQGEQLGPCHLSQVGKAISVWGLPVCPAGMGSAVQVPGSSPRWGAWGPGGPGRWPAATMPTLT